MEWLILLFNSGQSSFGYHAGEAAIEFVPSLTQAQRIQVLDAISPPERILGTPKVICALVGNDTEIYSHLLQLDHLHYYHLSPLLGEASGSWNDLQFWPSITVIPLAI